MTDEPCLRIAAVEPPILQCSECGAPFQVMSDSLREVLKAFRVHVAREHSPTAKTSKQVRHSTLKKK